MKINNNVKFPTRHIWDKYGDMDLPYIRLSILVHPFGVKMKYLTKELNLFESLRPWPKKNFSCKTAYAIFKVVYQASNIPKIRKIDGLVAETCSKTHIVHTFFAIFGPKKIFHAKLPMPYLK